MPTKNELFGKSQGAISRDVIAAGGNQENLLKNLLSNRYTEPSERKKSHHVSNKIYGNRSRFESTWISGPTH